MNLSFSFFLFCLFGNNLLVAIILREDVEIKEKSGLKVTTITPKNYDQDSNSTTYVVRGFVGPHKGTVVTAEKGNSAEIIDPDYNELAKALLCVPPKGHDYVAMKLMNPFDNRISWELPFLVDTGSTINYLRTADAELLGVKKANSCEVEYGNNAVEKGWLTVATVVLPIAGKTMLLNTTFCAGLAGGRNIISINLIHAFGLCHCPRKGVIPCENVLVVGLAGN